MLGVIFGLLMSFQYIIPELFKEVSPFNKLRPFHVTSVLSWIVLCATGSIYFYIFRVEKLKIFSKFLTRAHFLIFLFTGLAIFIFYLSGNMGGREYLAFPALVTIPILLGWMLFGVNYFLTITKKVSAWPVYYYMWGTGIVFMIYHLCEAHLWVFPYFRDSFIKDLSVQWKSYGSFIGSWNMLVYGIAIYVMSKIKNDMSLARGKLVFFFYFLGLTNLMFGWAHHTYIVPMQPWIRYVAYGVSMTEWILLAYIIFQWKNSINIENKQGYSMSYLFLVLADFWVFLNLILALLFSIPAINFFTHGTHITVAHSMGTTIGINTTILLASIFFIISKSGARYRINSLVITKAFKLFKISLFMFWVLLLVAGIKKSYWMYFTKNILFSEMQDSLFYVYCGISLFGFGIALSLIMLGTILSKSMLLSIKIRK